MILKWVDGKRERNWLTKSNLIGGRELIIALSLIFKIDSRSVRLGPSGNTGTHWHRVVKSNCVIFEIAIPLLKSNCAIHWRNFEKQFVFFARIVNRNLCFLRKLRIFIWIDQLEFGQNDNREDAPLFSFSSRRIRLSKNWIVLFAELCFFAIQIRIFWSIIAIFAIHFTTLHWSKSWKSISASNKEYQSKFKPKYNNKQSCSSYSSKWSEIISFKLVRIR